MWDAFLQHLLVLHFFQLILFYPILSKNVALRLNYQSHVYTLRWIRVVPKSIIITWDLCDTYHPLYLNIPLGCLDFLKVQNSTGPEGYIRGFPEKYVEWRLHTSLHDDHWVSFPDFFHLCRRNNDLCYRLYITRFPTIVHFSSHKERLVVCSFFSIGEGC